MSLCIHMEYEDECETCEFASERMRFDAACALAEAVSNAGPIYTMCDGYEAECRVCGRGWYPNSDYDNEEVHEDGCALAAYQAQKGKR